MLGKLTLHNFMPYEHTLFDFSDKRAVAVLGENGSGKSALLEAVYFALYGGSRDDLTVDDLVRESPEPLSMLVSLELKDIPEVGDQLLVTRGRSAGGVSSATLHWNGELHAKGATSVKDALVGLLGMDSELFLLTIFFGLGNNDSLMRVDSAKRLETLQRLANVGIYQKMHTVLKQRRSEIVRKGDKLRLRIETTTEDMSLTNKSLESVAEIKSELLELQGELATLQAKQAKFSSELEATALFRAELVSVQERLRLDKAQRTEAQRALDEEQLSLRSIQNDSTELATKIRDLRKSPALFQGKSSTTRAVTEKLEALREAAAFTELHLSLRRTAVQGEARGKSKDLCPLCSASLATHTQELWQTEIASLQTELRELQEGRKECEVFLSVYEKRDAELTKLVSRQQRLAEECQASEAVIRELSSEISRLDHGIETKLNRGKLLHSKVAKVDNVSDSIDTLNAQVGSKRERVGVLTQTLEVAKEKKKLLTQQRSRLKDLRAKEKRFLLKKKAVDALETAFSRYGIPFYLLGSLRKAIEKRATAIYRQFADGQILIVDVEARGRPGIDYVIENETGRRKYAQLSKGQQTMLVFSVRLAISRIIRAVRHVPVDFLILDELTGHLSDKNRDNLIQLIRRLAQQSFPQVFVVSHAEIRDIFDCKLQIEMVDAVARVRTLES